MHYKNFELMDMWMVETLKVSVVLLAALYKLRVNPVNEPAQMVHDSPIGVFPASLNYTSDDIPEVLKILKDFRSSLEKFNLTV